MEKIKAIVFDLDGTLLDTLDDLSENLNRVLSRRGFPIHSRQQYRKMVGRGLRVLTESATRGLALSARDFEELYEEFRREYGENPTALTRPYAQVEEMLSSLQEKVLLFILSNKEHTMTLKVVENLLGAYQFSEVHGMKPGKPGKPDPWVLESIMASYELLPREILYLGDSDVDMETACRAGVEACGALWGFRERDELEKSGAEKTFSSPFDFAEYTLTRL